MSSPGNAYSDDLYIYKYIDLEGFEYGPFDGRKMDEWNRKKLLDEQLVIFRISLNGKKESFRLEELNRMSQAPFLDKDMTAKEEENGSDMEGSYDEHSQSESPKSSIADGFEIAAKLLENEGKLSTQSYCELRNSEFQSGPLTREYMMNIAGRPQHVWGGSDTYCSSFDVYGRNLERYPEPMAKQYNPELYPSPPFLRLPDCGSPLISPEIARAKVFSLYQLIITIPEQLKIYPSCPKETVCCKLCKVDLSGPAIFPHLITIQHLSKVSSCVFSENDINYWIERIQELISNAPASALALPGFDPEVNLNLDESVTDFINRTKGFAKKLTIQRIKKCPEAIEVVLDVTSATSYLTHKSNRQKRKLTGRFLSRVVESLIRITDKTVFQRCYAKLLEEFNTCTFCDQRFHSFYDVCYHVGSKAHREKIGNLHYQEGHVATWVRLLSRSSSGGKRPAESNFASSVPKRQHLI